MTDVDPDQIGKPQGARRRGVNIFAIIGFIAVIGILVAGTIIGFKIYESNHTETANQAQLDPFYQPPSPVPPKFGTLIRSEPMNVDLANGSAFRILYTSQGPDGKPAAVSGMIFVPNSPAPPEGRKVLAWAHGTVGLAPQCAPSRSDKPLNDTQGWLDLALGHGWAVAATDYLGLGTPGPKTYLIGDQEARDVTNSVRALRNFEPAHAGNQWIVWGHSQGGHSSLWTGTLAQKIAPELKLIGVGAAAPADELTTIMQNQWQSTVGWVIGPEATVSFQQNYPDRDYLNSVSASGKRAVDKVDSQCTTGAGLTGLGYEDIANAAFFNSSPVNDPAWAQTSLEQTPPLLPASMPVFMSEGTADTVVLSGSNALMQEQWCAADADMSALWLGTTGHLAVANVSGPSFIEWATSVYGGVKPKKNCSFPPASPPLQLVVPPASALQGWKPQYPVAIPGEDASKPPGPETTLPTGSPSASSSKSASVSASASASKKS